MCYRPVHPPRSHPCPAPDLDHCEIVPRVGVLLGGPAGDARGPARTGDSNTHTHTRPPLLHLVVALTPASTHTTITTNRTPSSHTPPFFLLCAAYFLPRSGHPTRLPRPPRPLGVPSPSPRQHAKRRIGKRVHDAHPKRTVQNDVTPTPVDTQPQAPGAGGVTVSLLAGRAATNNKLRVLRACYLSIAAKSLCVVLVLIEVFHDENPA